MSGVVRLAPPADGSALHALLCAAFKGMAGRIDPPSSLERLTPESIEAFARDHALLAVAEAGRPVACLFCTATPEALYLGKLAVAPSHRRRGLARALVARAEADARRAGLPRLRLQTRIELVENHATFHALGFAEVARTVHPGFVRPTSITFDRTVAP